MDYPTHIETIVMEMSIMYYKGWLVNISKKKIDVFLSLKIVFILGNSAFPDEMCLLGLHSLPKCLYPE